MNSSSSLALPLLPAVDLVVVGATTAAACAARAARQAGLDVLLVSDRSYLGEETVGTLRLWQDPGPAEDAWLGELAQSRRQGVIFPGPFKRVLEQALLREGVRLLFQSRPVALLRASDGSPAGLLLAYRTSWMAVRCTAWVDATPGGCLARLASLPVQARRPRSPTLDWTVLAQEQPLATGAEVVQATGSPLVLPGNEAPMTVQGWTLRLPRPATDPRNLHHVLRAGFTDPSLRQTADRPVDWPAEVFGSAVGLAPSLADLPDDSFLAQPGLWLGGPTLPLAPEGLALADTLAGQVALGRRVGRLAAESVRGRSRPDAVRVEAGGTAGAVGRVVPAFLRESEGLLTIPAPLFPTLGSCDVAVVGGGTGGAPAGIAAARAGARTIVVETQHGLGGVGTLGLIASYYFGNRVGFTAEVDALIERLDPHRRDHRRWNPELKMAAWHRLLWEAGGEAWLDTVVAAVRHPDGRVDGLLLATPQGVGWLETGGVVDASGSAEVAAAAGAPCRWIDRRHVAVQGVGLSPRSPGRDYSNSDHTFIDDTDPAGVTHGFINARAKFTEEFDVATLVDSRERRQIVGELELSPLDFLAGRTFPDTLFTAASNFDTHGFTVHPVFMVVPPDKAPLRAHVPLRCMLPRDLEGVLVIGLGMSAHRDALPVIRMQADVQNQGFAAGRTVAAAARTGQPLRQLDLRALQEGLVAAGVLEAEVPRHGDSFPLPAAVCQAAVEAGPDSFFHTAVLFAHPEEVRPGLSAQLSDPARAAGAALVLGLLGDPAAGAVLAREVAATAWDEGWNYRGMGQFGRSMSRLDALLVALGRTRHPEAAGVVAAKIRALPDAPAFSHCRAVAVAACSLRDPSLAVPLRELLGRPGLRGHAQVDSAAVSARANPEWNETAARNAALRELYLARGLFACGDLEGVGRTILEEYARDLRGAFARHALALLAEGEDPDPREIA